MAERITENINSEQPGVADEDQTETTLGELCAATLRRRGRRGRPKGTGRNHPDPCTPKTFRNFSPLAHALLVEIKWTNDELRGKSEAEIVEEALVRIARALSNENPRLAGRLKRAGR